MGRNITFGIYKNILQLNNMGENGQREAGLPPIIFQRAFEFRKSEVESDF